MPKPMSRRTAESLYRQLDDLSAQAEYLGRRIPEDEDSGDMRLPDQEFIDRWSKLKKQWTRLDKTISFYL